MGPDESAHHTRGQPAVVRLRGVTRAYREGERSRAVLQQLDLSVAAGERIALLGRSGSGKSTLLNLIAGIDRPDSGEIWIHGRELSAMGERDRTLLRRRHIGFVYQAFNLIPTLSVEEHLRLPLELNGRGGADARRAIDGLLEGVGLADRRASFPDRLSGGEQQRVAIARAVVHEPSLVLADEPTGNLDADTGARIMTLLEALVADRGATLILVTHADEVAARADRILTLDHGRIEQTAGTGP